MDSLRADVFSISIGVLLRGLLCRLGLHTCFSLCVRGGEAIDDGSCSC